MAVAVEGQWDTVVPSQIAEQFEVATGVFIGSKSRRQDLAGGIVDRQVQGELGMIVAQPAMVAAVDLDQHPLPGHALSSYPVAGRTAAAGAL